MTWDHNFSNAIPSGNSLCPTGYEIPWDDDEEELEEDPEIDVFVAIIINERTNTVYQKIVTQYDTAFDRLVKNNCLKFGYAFPDRPSRPTGGENFGTPQTYRFEGKWKDKTDSYTLVLLHGTVIGNET